MRNTGGFYESNQGMMNRLRQIWRAVFVLVVGGMTLASIAIAGMWVRSYWRGDVVVLRQEQPASQAGSDSSNPATSLNQIRKVLFLSGRGGIGMAYMDEFTTRSESMLDQPAWTSQEDPVYPSPPPRVGTVAGLMLTPNGPIGNLELMPRSVRWAMEQERIRPPRGEIPQWGPFLGYQTMRRGMVPGTESHTWVVIFPYWAALLVVGMLPVYLSIRAGLTNSARRRRAATGCCIGCEYDLRATPGRCPECGKEAAAPSGTTHGHSEKSC